MEKKTTRPSPPVRDNHVPDRTSSFPRKGRGATNNPANRFLEHHSEPEYSDEPGCQPVDSITTELFAERAKTILTSNDSPDVPFKLSVNPYRGCEHGCIYCYARPSHAYMDLSPGLDFESKLYYKSNAAELLRAAFGKPFYQPAPVSLGANTDPYQPIERRLEITRKILQVFQETRHPVAIITKSALILRDLDLLQDLARDGLVQVMISIATLDNVLARRMEPRANTPKKRLEAIATLNQAGVSCGVMTAPIIPGLNDHDLEHILEAAHGAGARAAGTVLIRLPLEVRELFQDWLWEHYPERANKVLNLIRDCRGGELYSSEYSQRMQGRGPIAEMIQQRFHIAVRKLGMEGERALELNTKAFRPPVEEKRQLSLF